MILIVPFNFTALFLITASWPGVITELLVAKVIAKWNFGFGVGVGDALGVGVGVGVGEALGVGVGVTDGVGVGVGVTDGVGVGVGVGVTDGVGAGGGGSLGGGFTTGAAAILNSTVVVAVSFKLLVTINVVVRLPEALGVPLTRPAVLTLSPVGRVEDATVALWDSLPAIVRLNALIAVPAVPVTG